MGGLLQQISAFWNEDRSLRFFLWLTIGLVFAITPLEALGLVEGYLFRTVALGAFLVGTFTVSRRLVFRAAGTGLLVGLGLLSYLSERSSNPGIGAAHSLVGATFAFSFAGMVLRQSLRPGEITQHRIEGAVATYLMIGLGFAWLFQALEVFSPGAFVLAHPLRDTATGAPQLVYFSFATLTTVGYGDITALHPVGRSLAAFEALIGQIYPAVLLARLVSMEVSRNERK
ncbi:MAG: potassium channel family protein [Polyangiales bacterium]